MGFPQEANSTTTKNAEPTDGDTNNPDTTGVEMGKRICCAEEEKNIREKKNNNEKKIMLEEEILAAGAYGGIGAVAFACKQLLPHAECVAAAAQVLTQFFQAFRNRELLPVQGAEALCSALAAHQDSPQVQHCVFLAVTAACTKSEKNKRMLHAAGMNTHLLYCLSNHSKHTPVATAAWAFLRVFVSDDDRREGVQPNTFVRARELGENLQRGVVRPLLAPLRSSDDPALTSPLCAATAAELLQTLKHVAVNDLVCKHIKNSKGIEVILEAVLAHLHDPGVARHGCGLIKAVSRNDEIKQYVGKGDGLGVLLKAMEQHAAKAPVVEQALAAMSVLSLRHPQNCERIADLGAIRLITSLMESHPEQAGVQRQAISTLRNMVSDWKNKPLVQAILDSGAEPLIRKARSEHPICEEVAYAALRDLGLSYHAA